MTPCAWRGVAKSLTYPTANPQQCTAFGIPWCAPGG
ncbi:hypothetical protein [Micromonospora sp. NPDC023956]